MYEYFARLRKLPEPQRRKRAFFMSLAITLIILAIWASFLFYRIDNGLFAAKDDASPKDGSPGIVATFSNFFKGMKDTFKTGNTYENSSSTK